jgi:hypothetical protein
MNRRISRQIFAGELEKRCGGTQTVLLQMHKGASELDERFVECVIWPATLRQPKFFQHLMRFKKELLIEALEICGVMRIMTLPRAIPDQLCDACWFLTQAAKVLFVRRGSNANCAPAQDFDNGQGFETPLTGAFERGVRHWFIFGRWHFGC